ncbi:hypothetical protein FBU59_005220, partial [Linderina macrospora]
MHQQCSTLTTEKHPSQTRTARQIVDLGQRGFSEPPLITKREEKYSQEEIEFAVFRLRRKLRRYLLHRRTPMKLEAMWELYAEIKRMSDWRINGEQLEQFLQAILRDGDRTEAGLPAKSEQVLECAFGVTDQPVRALRELLLSWARNKNVDQAWSMMSQLLKIGHGKGTREWNTLLHMHAVDLRYRYDLIEQVLARMRKAGAAYDQVTYNIMMHACLLRGKQVLWKDWHKRMEQAGFAPDVYTYTALVSQLVNNGQWGEALNIIKHMRTSNIQPTTATSVAVMSMERKRGHAKNIMDKFRQSVLK